MRYRTVTDAGGDADSSRRRHWRRQTHTHKEHTQSLATLWIFSLAAVTRRQWQLKTLFFCLSRTVQSVGRVVVFCVSGLSLFVAVTWAEAEHVLAPAVDPDTHQQPSLLPAFAVRWFIRSLCPSVSFFSPVLLLSLTLILFLPVSFFFQTSFFVFYSLSLPVSLFSSLVFS